MRKFLRIAIPVLAAAASLSVARADDDEDDGSFRADFSTKNLAQLTPIDQYKAITEEFQDAQGYGQSDALYVADALETRLTETGRLGFLDWCYMHESTRAEDDMVKWAICQPDADRFDAKKLEAELRDDAAHEAPARSYLKKRAVAVAAAIKETTATRAKLFKNDDTWKKLFDVAKRARAEWTKGAGADAAGLDLALAMDSAVFFHSRKLFEGCQDKTRAALEKAISTIPAKSFKAMHDVRDDPHKGFAYGAGPLLANTPAVNLAAIAFVDCQKETPTGDFLAEAIQRVPGVRGPRSQALGALMGETFQFDDTQAGKLSYVDFSNRPYSRSGGAVGSAGGVAKTIKPGKASATIAIEKTFVMQEDCVKSHPSNRAARVVVSGNTWSIERESICDKTQMVKHDLTWGDFEINAAQAKLLKPGVVFSTTYGQKVSDVLAVWPSKSATVPSLVLGAPVK
jgi:hypothetical protein